MMSIGRTIGTCLLAAGLFFGSAILKPATSDSADVNAKCGACHFSSKAPGRAHELSETDFARCMHGRRGVSCVKCHTDHTAGGGKGLIKPVEQLCVGCHASVLEDSPGRKAAYTHSPVAQGKCLMCHAPHGTRQKAMLVEDARKVCGQCHDVADPKLAAAHSRYPISDSNCNDCHDPHSHDRAAKLISQDQHAPFKQRQCEICHVKPSPGQPVALVKPAKELCTTCHPLASLVKQGEMEHLPVKEGFCTSCHQPHASPRKGLLVAREATVCFKCHGKVENDTLSEHRHKVLDDTMKCSLCHKPHGSPQEKLLNRDEMTLCGQCHKHTFSHPMGKKPDGSLLINPSTGKQLVCAGCHGVHGSKYESMALADKKRELCVRCHREVGD